MTTITREQLHERARRKVKELEFAITQSAFTSIRDGLNEELELARIALASLDAEPVAWTSEGALAEVYCGETGVIGPKYIVGDVPLYRHAAPAPAVIQSSQLLHDFYRAYADWLISGGDGQFSCVNGLCANLFDYCDRKGVGSAQALNEMHVQFVTAGMNEKLPFNTSVTDFDAESADGKCHLNTARRKWVFRRIIDGVKPALVVPDERAAFNAWNNEDNLPIAGVGAKNAAWLAWQARASLCGNSALNVPPERPADSSNGDDVEAWFDEGWNACRTAMLNGGKS